jgi:hypothetical protein
MFHDSKSTLKIWDNLSFQYHKKKKKNEKKNLTNFFDKFFLF